MSPSDINVVSWTSEALVFAPSAVVGKEKGKRSVLEVKNYHIVKKKISVEMTSAWPKSGNVLAMPGYPPGAWTACLFQGHTYLPWVHPVPGLHTGSY